ncbi:MAG: FlgD immunoglobulin-like domain containing protein [bacterium]
MNSKRVLLCLMVLASFFVARSILNLPDGSRGTVRPDDALLAARPNDWFFRQRAFPYEDIPYQEFYSALQQSRSVKARYRLAAAEQWQFAGPTNIGGRITDVEMSPTSFDTLYVGAASGGIFRSADRGQSWEPIFDQALSLSIGDLALDPGNPRVIYAGTGEPNAGGGSLTYGGMGVYKSSDSGQTWTHLGLEKTRFIGRIAVDPRDARRIYVAAMGNLFSTNTERGLYRSLDGGASWENVLFLSDSTGCIDVVVHPTSPDTVYAAMWERRRFPNGRLYGGVTSGLYRSADGGDSWTELTQGLPNNSPDVGRIGVAISASDPTILYAIYADHIGPFAGIYRSSDGGDSWQRTNDGVLRNVYATFGWWFGNIRIDPSDPDILYVLGLDVYKTTDAGASWSRVFRNIHVDQHGMVVHPLNPDFVVVGNDGGLYLSANAGATWSKSPHLPITQFYTCEIDEQHPHRLYGGTQDNGTNRTLTGDLDDWQNIFFGDGFYVLVDPLDNRFVYAEFQFGGLGRSTNGGRSFTFAQTGISGNDRFNWNSPLAFNPLNPRSLYFGGNRLYKSTDRASSWRAVSPDLSNGPSTRNFVFGTMTTLAVAPSDSNTIYTGLDDGNVWVTQDGGQNWRNISADLPVRWITRVAVDPEDGRIAYVTLSGFRRDGFLPHIFRTENGGESWQDISSNLPEVPLNDVIVDPEMRSTLYVASDVGVFVTRNSGAEWLPLGEGLPNVPVTDLDLHAPTRTLVAATYGRSMYRIALGEATGVEPGIVAQAPDDFQLRQNYPNPFNAGTTIPYSLPNEAHIRLEVHDIAGRLVRTLVDGPQSAGAYVAKWDGGNDRGVTVASGMYIYRLRTDERILARRMILVK